LAVTVESGTGEVFRYGVKEQGLTRVQGKVNGKLLQERRKPLPRNK